MAHASKIKLSKEALLFDSSLYIIKAMLAVATGFLIGKALPIAHLDIMSLLLGVMYNLEPLNTSGLKRTVNQIVATFIGGLGTALLILFFGINLFTVALGMGFTLFVCLKINWRAISPIAIFTSIYMTQYIQFDWSGEPNVMLTFQLRMLALVVGIFIAIFYNFVFSMLFYKQLPQKRLQLINDHLIENIELCVIGLQQGTQTYQQQCYKNYASLQQDLDIIALNLEMSIKESRLRLNQLDEPLLIHMQALLSHYREINHLLYDISYHVHDVQGDFIEIKLELLKLNEVSDVLAQINYVLQAYPVRQTIETHIFDDLQLNRVTEDVKSLCVKVNEMLLKLESMTRK